MPVWNTLSVKKSNLEAVVVFTLLGDVVSSNFEDRITHQRAFKEVV